MTRNLYEPTDQSKISQNRYKIKDTRQKPLASQWIQPVNAGDSIPDADPEYTPELENDWLQPSAPLATFAFRLHYDGSLEFRGHLDTSGGAVSGTIAVTLPGGFVGDPDYRPRNDQYWHTTVTTDDGGTFFLAMVFIDATTGATTITWPHD